VLQPSRARQAALLIPLDGRVAVDWGVYGVPETFVIDRDGRIAYNHIGPITPTVRDHTLLPLIRRLQGRSP
jgi:cytochrome c biogenesis protein CcmG/thiol:disulfide interchange protein DsbE